MFNTLFNVLQYNSHLRYFTFSSRVANYNAFQIGCLLRWRAAIAYLQCFSGGVFIGACILDLFLDVRESVEKVVEELEKEYHVQVSLMYVVP